MAPCAFIATDRLLRHSAPDDHGEMPLLPCEIGAALSELSGKLRSAGRKSWALTFDPLAHGLNQGRHLAATQGNGRMRLNSIVCSHRCRAAREAGTAC